jgi:hypothetical protein
VWAQRGDPRGSRTVFRADSPRSAARSAARTQAQRESQSTQQTQSQAASTYHGRRTSFSIDARGASGVTYGRPKEIVVRVLRPRPAT